MRMLRLGQRLAHLVEGEGLLADQVEDLAARLRERLRGAPSVGRELRVARLDLLLEAGDADLEELVEVDREDRQEADPLEERVALVARLVQDACIEVEPGELAIDVRNGRRGCWGVDDGGSLADERQSWVVGGWPRGRGCVPPSYRDGDVRRPWLVGQARRWDRLLVARDARSGVADVRLCRAPCDVLVAGAVRAEPLEGVVAGVVAVGPRRADRVLADQLDVDQSGLVRASAWAPNRASPAVRPRRDSRRRGRASAG